MTKEQIAKELEATKQIFIDERLFLIEDQCSFNTLINYHINFSNTKFVKEMTEETIKFVSFRKNFLEEKERQLFHYITHIRKIEEKLDYVTTSDLESIDGLLRLMLASISRSAPTTIFGEPF